MSAFQSNLFKFSIAALCIAAPVLAVTLPDYDRVMNFAIHWNYWLAAAIFVEFLVISFRVLKGVGTGGMMNWVRLRRFGLVSSLVLALFLQVGEPHKAKVLCDEGLICGVAYEMHNERVAAFPVTMHTIEGKQAVTRFAADKRPVGYPFVLATFHDLTGYRYGNVFVLNAVFGFALLLLLYEFAEPLIGRTGAVAVQLLLCTLPLVAQNATAAGFEVFNLCLIVALALAARRYLAMPGESGLDLFVAVGLVLSIARYESALYLAAILGIVVFKWVRERRITLTWFAVFSPLLLLSAYLSLRVFTGNAGFFQEDHGQFLSFSHLGGNLMAAYRFLAAMPKGNCANSLIFGVVGVGSLVAFAYCLFDRKAKAVLGDARVVVFAILVVALVNTFIGLCENMGQWDVPIAARFALPIHLLFALCFAATLAVFLRGKTVPAFVPVVLAAWIVFVTSVQIARHDMTNRCPFALEYPYFTDWAERNATSRDLFVMDFPPMLIMKGFSCAPISSLNENAWKYQNVLDEKIYDNVFLCEIYALVDNTSEWKPYYICTADGYTAKVRREVVAQTRIRPSVMVRISRLTAVDDPEVEKHRRPADSAQWAQWFNDSLP
jgi:hypothetical protein